MRFATRAMIALGLVAGTVASASAAVTINEFKAKGTEFIELYNSGPGAVDVTGWTLNDGTGPEVLAGVIAAGGFMSVATILGLDNSGAVIELRDGAAVLVDRVGYGNRGGAPLGFNSTGRSPDGDDTDDDARDFEYLDDTFVPNETPGAANANGVPALGSSIIINEVKWQADNIAPNFDAIELYNPTAAGISVQGWWVSDGDGFCQIKNAIVVPGGGWVTLTKAVVGEGLDCVSFDEVAISGTDVMYIYRGVLGGGAPTRVDQVGIDINGPGAGLGETYQRCADGQGPNDGYDYPSTGGGTNYFSASPTLGGTNAGICPVQNESSTWGRVKGLYR